MPPYKVRNTSQRTHLYSCHKRYTVSLNTTSRTGKEIPLHVCCYLGKMNLAETLLAYGTNPNVRDVDGDTHLH